MQSEGKAKRFHEKNVAVVEHEFTYENFLLILCPPVSLELCLKSCILDMFWKNYDCLQHTLQTSVCSIQMDNREKGICSCCRSFYRYFVPLTVKTHDHQNPL